MSFSKITDLAQLPAALRGGVVAIGNFDGVHRGHQAVLMAALTKAKALDVPALVLTFEPHPRTFFKPDVPVFRLTNAHTKAQLIENIGFDAVIEDTFDADFAATLADDFIRNVLINTLGAVHVVTGYDFHFGKGRQGSPDYLANAGNEYGFGTTIVEAFNDEADEVISSSRIRECIGAGDIAQANGLLGYAFRSHGEVIKGKQLGRELGFPTANLSLPGETQLAHGIYAVRVILSDGSLKDGVASYGRRPTFDNGEALLETFIFDFSGDLYGQMISICLIGWIRAEEKFDSVELLIEQMDKDTQEAKSILAACGSTQDQTGNLWPILHDA